MRAALMLALAVLIMTGSVRADPSADQVAPLTGLETDLKARCLGLLRVLSERAPSPRITESYQALLPGRGLLYNEPFTTLGSFDRSNGQALAYWQAVNDGSYSVDSTLADVETCRKQAEADK